MVGLQYTTKLVWIAIACVCIFGATLTHGATSGKRLKVVYRCPIGSPPAESTASFIGTISHYYQCEMLRKVIQITLPDVTMQLPSGKMGGTTV